MKQKRNQNMRLIGLFSFFTIIVLIIIICVAIFLIMKKSSEPYFMKTDGPTQFLNSNLILYLYNKTGIDLIQPIFRIYMPDLLYLHRKPPTVKCYKDGVVYYNIKVDYMYQHGNYDNWMKGQRDRGYDMYCVAYYIYKIPSVEYIEIDNINNISYWSLNYKISDSQTSFNWISALHPENDQMKAVYSTLQDPFIVGNPSTGSYGILNETLSSFPISKIDTLEVPSSMAWENSFPRIVDSKLLGSDVSNELMIFRPDRQSSAIPGLAADCYTPGTCCNTYLAAPVTSNMYPQFPDFNYGTITIKVPKMYDGRLDQLTPKYDTLYFSLSTDFEPGNEPANLLPYWTVNAIQLDKIKDKNGYAHVFFAKYEEVYKYYKAMQNPNDYTPPIITRGDVTGYLIGKTKYLYIFRYRDSLSSWKGSAENAHCYPTLSTNRPVHTSRRKNEFPMIVGEPIITSLDEFLNTSPSI